MIPPPPLLDEAAWRCVAERCGLSKRECQIAKDVFQDVKESVIARNLGISIHTVHTHLERLYRKLGVSSRVQLVVKLVECRMALTIEPASPLQPICPHHSAGRCPLCN